MSTTTSETAAPSRAKSRLDTLTIELYGAFSSGDLSKDDLIELKYIIDGLLQASESEMIDESESEPEPEPEPESDEHCGPRGGRGALIKTYRHIAGKRYGPYMELRYYAGMENGRSRYTRKYVGKHSAKS